MVRAGVVLLISVCCLGQTAEPEIAARDAQVNFSTRVNLVEIPVVVRDHDGKAIGTLKAEDFQLFDLGKPQTIARFSVENTGESLATLRQPTGDVSGALPGHFRAYLVDDVRLDAGELSAMRTLLAKHISDTMKASDRVAIFPTSGVGALDFTDDREQIAEALKKLQPRSRLNGATECPPISFSMADEIVNHDNQAVLALAVADAMKCMNLIDVAGPGGGGTSGQPQAISAVRASATRILALGESEAQQTFSVLRDVVARMSTAPGERAMVLISTGIYLTEIYRSYESELLDRALRAKVTISTLNMHGSFVASQTDIDRGSTAKSATARLGYTQQEAQAGDDILTELAEGTGGTYFHNSNDAAEGLRVTAATPEYIYLLGFAPQNLKYDGKFHSVKVALKAANYTLEARRGYYAPRQAPNEQLQAQEELKEWMYSREDSQEFPIALETQFFKPTSESGRITALGKVDLHGVRFVKAEGRNRDTIYIVVGIFDRNGNILKAGGRVVDLKFKDETMAAHIEQGLALKLSFDVAPGKYLVRLVVRSSEGEMMAARNGVVEIP